MIWLPGAPLICRPIDFDTLESIVSRLQNGKSTGSAGIPLEYYKYGPKVLLELLRSAFDVYLAGVEPTEYAHEWEGAMCGLIVRRQLHCGGLNNERLQANLRISLSSRPSLLVVLTK